MNNGSFKEQTKISFELLKERIETIKELSQSETEMYEISKDKQTDEHYLHYSYLHRNIADTGEPEIFHHLLPLASDDVLGILFGEQSYTYPKHWQQAFLRNGPIGYCIWFDPQYAAEEQHNEKIGQRIISKLQEYKSTGSIDEESIQRLLKDLDETH